MLIVRAVGLSGFVFDILKMLQPETAIGLGFRVEHCFLCARLSA